MSGALLLFAPGAGAPSTSGWMTAWAARLASIGAVCPFDYDYQRAGRKRPDRMPVLIATHRDALRAAHEAHPGARIVLIGKSMGSRVGCHLSLEVAVDALVCFGYPLLGQGDPTKRRDEVLRALRTRVLFVQGTRDPLCPLDALDEVRATMTAPSTLHVVPTGDHSLQVTAAHRKATGRTQQEEDVAVLDAVLRFVG